MLRDLDSQELLSVILAEGRTCECPHKEGCGNIGNAWCRHIVEKADGGKSFAYRDLSVARCAYRERPGCCWVLATVERMAAGYLDRQHIDRPPAPSSLIEAFDDTRDIEVRLLPLRSLHGAVWLIENEWVVQLNATDSPEERRETLFHEAFHIACRSASPAFRRVDMGQRPFRDILADHFAACLLMPKDWIEDYAPAIRDTARMARVFDVSVSAMRHRLKQLGLSNGGRVALPDLHGRGGPPTA
jgi:hypothetical protein